MHPVWCARRYWYWNSCIVLDARILVMQTKTLALKSRSANQRWCKIRTKTTVCMDSASRNGVRGGRGHCRSDDAVYNCLAARLPGNFTTLSAQMRCFIWPLLTARVVRRLPSSLATRMPIPFQNVSRGPSSYGRTRGCMNLVLTVHYVPGSSPRTCACASLTTHPK